MDYLGATFVNRSYLAILVVVFCVGARATGPTAETEGQSAALAS